jgi:hypothetical protein
MKWIGVYFFMDISKLNEAAMRVCGSWGSINTSICFKLPTRNSFCKHLATTKRRFVIKQPWLIWPIYKI